MCDRGIRRIEDRGRFVQIEIGLADGVAAQELAVPPTSLSALLSPMGRKEASTHARLSAETIAMSPPSRAERRYRR
jgi:hypothetical protein